MVKQGSIVALSMALTACMSLEPKYERPAAPIAAAFPDAQATGGEAAPGIDWKRYFADARLRRLIELALVNNRDLRIAVANIEQARAQFRIRRADQAPTLALGVQGKRAADEDDKISSSYAGGLQVSAFELDLFGRVRNLSTAAEAQFFASEENRRAVQISIIASVANTYLATLADEELLDLTRRTLAAREESRKLVQLKFDNGVVSRIDLQQANSLVESARVVLAQQQRQRAASQNLLTLLAGQPLPADLPPAARLADTVLAELPAGLPSDLLAVRPDVRAAEQQLIAANANIGAARAAYFPRISLTAGVGSASEELSGLFKGGSWGWTLAPQLLLPIFDMGRTSAGVAAAHASRDAALAQYERAIQSAFREVADGLAGQATYGEQLRAQRAVAAAEQERFDLSDLRYRNGAASYLDLLDAQRSLFAAQQAAIQANLARLQNQVTLFRVLGGN